MTTATRTFLGIPIEGDINEGERMANQRPLEDLQPTIQAVLDDPLIAKFGWTQYTPYFNDGEPCIFRVGDPWFITTEDEVNIEVDGELGKYEYEVDCGRHPSLGYRDYEWVGDWPNRERIDRGYEGNHEASYERARALNKAIQSGEFNNVVLDAFGDHAEITITRDGITVESYEHD